MDMVKKLFDKGAGVNAKNAAGDAPPAMVATRATRSVSSSSATQGADVTSKSTPWLLPSRLLPPETMYCVRIRQRRRSAARLKMTENKGMSILGGEP